jgi:acyl carrier protein
MPTLEQLLAELEKLAEIEPIDPDAPIASVEVDSLDLLEWVCALEDEYGLKVDEEDLAELAQQEGMSFRVIYERIAHTQAAA